MLIMPEPAQRVVLGHGLALLGKVQALWEKFHVLLALFSAPRLQLPPLLLPDPSHMGRYGSGLFFQVLPVQVGDTAGHQDTGHPSLPPGRSVPEPWGTVWATPSHHPGEADPLGAGTDVKSPLQNPKSRRCKTGGGNAKGSPGLSDGKLLHVHPSILPFIQLLMGLSSAR